MAWLISWVLDMILIFDNFQSEFLKEDPKKGGCVDCWLLTRQGLWPPLMCQLSGGQHAAPRLDIISQEELIRKVSS